MRLQQGMSTFNIALRLCFTKKDYLKLSSNIAIAASNDNKPSYTCCFTLANVILDLMRLLLVFVVFEKESSEEKDDGQAHVDRLGEYLRCECHMAMLARKVTILTIK